MMTKRVLGEVIPLSVGTAIAFEAILADKVFKPEGAMHINLRTLFRNLHNAFESKKIYDPLILADIMMEEIDTIRNFSKEDLGYHIVPNFYVATYKTLSKQTRFAKIKVAKTKLQKDFNAAEVSTIDTVVKRMLDMDKSSVDVYDCSINGDNLVSLMLTHFPLDLASYHKFKQLRLLESHTGAVKERKVWITKLSNNERYKNIPFNMLSIQLIGDMSKLVSASRKKALDALVDLSVEGEWTPMTTASKIRFDIRNKIKDPALSDLFLSMLNTKLK